MNQELLKQLYIRYSKEIYFYLLSFVKQPEWAEDLMQETFLKAILSLNEQHNNIRAWLYMVARNLALNTLKKKGNQEIANQEQIELIPRSKSILDEYLKSEREKILLQGLSDLPQREKEVLTLQYFGELSQKEIAKLMGLKPEHVRVVAHRAKKQLKEYMEVQGYGK